MPITISRTSQAAAPAIQISQEQRDLLWEALLRAYIERHPEILIEKKQWEREEDDNDI